MVADLHATTFELRISILEAKAQRAGVPVPDKVMEFLAHKITSNVRELEGALNRLLAQANLFGRPVTLEATQEVLHDILKAYERRVTIDEIQRKVAEHYNMRLTDMFSARRARNVARPRQVAMYLAKQLTSRSLPEIGRKFGNRDHTTVMHAVSRVGQLIEVDPAFAEDVELLRRMLEGGTELTSPARTSSRCAGEVKTRSVEGEGDRVEPAMRVGPPASCPPPPCSARSPHPVASAPRPLPREARTTYFARRGAVAGQRNAIATVWRRFACFPARRVVKQRPDPCRNCHHEAEGRPRHPAEGPGPRPERGGAAQHHPDPRQRHDRRARRAPDADRHRHGNRGRRGCAGQHHPQRRLHRPGRHAV